MSHTIVDRNQVYWCVLTSNICDRVICYIFNSWISSQGTPSRACVAKPASWQLTSGAHLSSPSSHVMAR